MSKARKVVLAVLFAGLMSLSMFVGKVAAEGNGGGLPWNLGVGGDVIYDISAGELGGGASINLLTFYPDALVEIRGGAYELGKSGKQKVGLTVAVSIPALARRLGADWIPEKINSSLGVSILAGFRDDESISQIQLSPAVFLTVIRIDF